MRRLLILLALTSTADAQPSAEQRIDNLLARMTLEEKLGQISQYAPDQTELDAALSKGLVGSILNASGPQQSNEIQRKQMAASRLKLPLLVGHDVIHGYRTIFPIPLAIASSWDPSLAERSAAIAAREARASGVRWTFAPMIDIARDARWGRIAEGSGEDPHLGSAMAAAYVRGFQANGLLACAKHFVAYGVAEGGRDYDSANIPERTLREVYLPPFRAAVDAGVRSMMSSFNSIDGIPVTANRRVLGDILRGEWKFDGFVVSDWDAVAELMNHGVAGTREEAALLAIRAGVDMAMWDRTYMSLANLSPVPTAQIDEAVRRVLRAKTRAGLFDDPYTDETRTAAALLTTENRQAARRVAQRSIVLLKNEGNLLPLPKSGRTIAVIGPLAGSKEDMLGGWSAQGKAEETISVLEGLRSARPAARLLHAKGTGVLEGTGKELSDAIETAKQSDVIIAVLGESRDLSSEAASRSSLDLPGQQQQLLEALVATGKPVVLVVLSGRPLSISWAASHVPAIVQAWFLGTEGGHAIADVLFGDISPSAKLPVTVPRTVGQVPIYYAHLPTGRPANEKDKFTSKYIDIPLGPLYPFGFGLSYTRFEYGNLRLSAPSITMGGRLTVSADVKNAGGRDGEEVVQLYLRDPVASVSRPVRELKGFQRVALKPGETKRVEFTIATKDLEFWGADGWIAEPGLFHVWIAPDSASGVMGTFELTAEKAPTTSQSPR